MQFQQSNQSPAAAHTSSSPKYIPTIRPPFLQPHQASIFTFPSIYPNNPFASSYLVNMSAPAPEKKPNFVRTCNLLGQYLHGKVSLRDLSLGIGKSDVCRDTATMDFLGNLGKSSQDGEASCKESKTAQLTIFYSGKLMVFDDFPADKARAVMLLASKGSPQSTCAVFPAAADPPPLPLQHAETNASDLPIARRSSLHRFLEKRKDRAIARAPYQLHNHHSAMPSSSKNLPSSSSNNGGDEDSSSNSGNELLDLNFKL